jgi:hypothetical protein
MIVSDLRYSHEHSPRKQRSFRHSNYFKPTIYWKGSRGIFTPTSDKFGARWKGKVFIPYEKDEPWQIAAALKTAGKPFLTSSYALEYEIMRTHRPNIYRIIRVGYDGRWLSKFGVEYRPQRLNILLNPTDVIVGIMYF